MRTYYNQSITKTLAGALVDKVQVALDSCSLLSHCPDRFLDKKCAFSAEQFFYQADPESCYRDPDDGLWYLHEPNHNGRIVRFFWRITPHGGGRGKPIYTWAEIEALRDKSETVKTLFDTGRVQLKLELVDFRSAASPVIWGLDYQQRTRLYLDGNLIFDINTHDRSWKRLLKEAVENLDKTK